MGPPALRIVLLASESPQERAAFHMEFKRDAASNMGPVRKCKQFRQQVAPLLANWRARERILAPLLGLVAWARPFSHTEVGGCRFRH
jgi:hypothetical protein